MLDNLPRLEQKDGINIQLNITSINVPESEEGYVLDIGHNIITINSKTSKGLFYGCATLEQLMEDSKLWNINIPQLVINDYPAIDFRAIWNC